MPCEAPVMTMTLSFMRASSPKRTRDLSGLTSWIDSACSDTEQSISMRRLACLDLPALPLQLVWRSEPALRDQPVVVIDEDRPQGQVLWASERARHHGVLTGQRYAHALSLCGGLKARVIPPEQIAQAIVELRTALHALSPNVEVGEPGTFWLDGDGLDRIFVDGREAPGTVWGMTIARAIAERDLLGAVVIGFS